MSDCTASWLVSRAFPLSRPTTPVGTNPEYLPRRGAPSSGARRRPQGQLPRALTLRCSRSKTSSDDCLTCHGPFSLNEVRLERATHGLSLRKGYAELRSLR